MWDAFKNFLIKSDIYFIEKNNSEIIIPAPCDATNPFGEMNMTEIIFHKNTVCASDECYIHVKYDKESNTFEWLVEIEN